jgi:hypothetical protein
LAQAHDDDPLGFRLDGLGEADPKEAGLLEALAAGSVLVLLAMPPGEGANRPERNLIEWHDQTDNVTFVPLFSAGGRIPGAFPPPMTLARVPVRLLLSLAGRRYYVLNPLSPNRLILTPSRIDQLLAIITHQSGETSVPSRQSPWGFRLPPDEWYPIARALAAWIIDDGRLSKAFLYELLRGEAPPQMVLGLEVRTDPSLALTLREVAERAGAAPGSLVVRFLPDEPSHAQGVTGMGLEPFYERPIQ